MRTILSFSWSLANTLLNIHVYQWKQKTFLFISTKLFHKLTYFANIQESMSWILKCLPFYTENSLISILCYSYISMRILLSIWRNKVLHRKRMSAFLTHWYAYQSTPDSAFIYTNFHLVWYDPTLRYLFRRILNVNPNNCHKLDKNKSWNNT